MNLSISIAIRSLKHQELDNIIPLTTLTSQHSWFWQPDILCQYLQDKTKHSMVQKD